MTGLDLIEDGNIIVYVPSDPEWIIKRDDKGLIRKWNQDTKEWTLSKISYNCLMELNWAVIEITLMLNKITAIEDDPTPSKPRVRVYSQQGNEYVGRFEYDQSVYGYVRYEIRKGQKLYLCDDDSYHLPHKCEWKE